MLGNVTAAKTKKNKNFTPHLNGKVESYLTGDNWTCGQNEMKVGDKINEDNCCELENNARMCGS